jgi:hypothetical protein
MTVVYKLDDRFELKFGDLTFELAPLSLDKKAIAASKMFKEGGDVMANISGVAVTLAHSIKSVKGLKNADGSDYKLEFNEDGSLTDECVGEVMNISESAALISIGTDLMKGMPETVVNRYTGEEMKGVKIKYKGKAPKKDNG